MPWRPNRGYLLWGEALGGDVETPIDAPLPLQNSFKYIFGTKC